MMSATAATAQQSQLNIGGSADFYQVAPGAANNLVIDFLPAGGLAGTVRTTQFPEDQTGIFAGIAPNTMGVQTDLVFGTAGSPTPTNTPFTLLVLGGYTFTATAFGTGNVPGTPVSLDFLNNVTVASLQVFGTVTGNGFNGTFIGGYDTRFPGLTPAQVTSQIESNQVLSKSIAATFVVTPTSTVPEPSTYVLLATGIGALGMVARRRRTTV
jgi:hypothetical protein